MRFPFRLRAAQAAGFAVLAGGAGAQAHADDIIVFGTVAAKSALEQIAPAFERDTHHKLVLHIATTGELAADIAKGAPFDVALLTQAALDDLIKQGKLDAASKLDVAKVGVGVAVAKNVAPPAIANAEEFKRTLLAAKSITYTAQGATGPTMKKIFERFGIGEAMQAKTVIAKGMTAPQAVAAGQAEMGFTQVSEILDAPAAQLAGPLPPELQVYSTFSAAVAVDAKSRAAAQAFVATLKSPAAKAILTARGLQPF